MRVLLVSANREQLPSPVAPLGLLYIAAAARASGHDVRLLDLCFENDPHRAIADELSTAPCDVIGVGLRNLHGNTYGESESVVDWYQSVLATLRAHSTAKIVLGGSGFSLQPRGLLARLGGDHGVVGEGEHVFVSLLDALARGDTPEPLVYGNAVKRDPETSLSRARRSVVPNELDALPAPARDLVDGRYVGFDGTVNVQSKRGCAFQCTYCDYPDLEGRRVRVRNPESFADEVAMLAREPNVSHAFVVDSVFNVPKSHARACCEALKRRGSPLPWVCYGSPVAFDHELVAAMAEARCVGVEIGSDSGTEEVLARLRKPFRRADILRTRALFERHGIADCHTFVLGAEQESSSEVDSTLRFVEELAPEIAVFIVFMEDREDRGVCRAAHRTAILELLAKEAPRHPGWIVPELDIRFGRKITQLVERRGLRGPAWLHLAQVVRQLRNRTAQRALGTTPPTGKTLDSIR